MKSELRYIAVSVICVLFVVMYTMNRSFNITGVTYYGVLAALSALSALEMTAMTIMSLSDEEEES